MFDFKRFNKNEQNFNNLFVPLSKEERKQKNELKEKLNQTRLETIAHARKCINTEDFQKYKKQLLEAREITIKSILFIRDDEPIRYAFKIQELVNDYRNLESLLGTLNKEAGENE